MLERLLALALALGVVLVAAAVYRGFEAPAECGECTPLIEDRASDTRQSPDDVPSRDDEDAEEDKRERKKGKGRDD